MLSLLIGIGAAHGYVAEECQDVADAGPPADYDEQAQQDFLLNYFALATTLSPLHAPVPSEAPLLRPRAPPGGTTSPSAAAAQTLWGGR